MADNPALRWVLIDFTIAVGDRRMVRQLLCARNTSGDFVATASDVDLLDRPMKELQRALDDFSKNRQRR